METRSRINLKLRGRDRICVWKYRQIRRVAQMCNEHEDLNDTAHREGRTELSLQLRDHIAECFRVDPEHVTFPVSTTPKYMPRLSLYRNRHAANDVLTIVATFMDCVKPDTDFLLNNDYMVMHVSYMIGNVASGCGPELLELLFEDTKRQMLQAGREKLNDFMRQHDAATDFVMHLIRVNEGFLRNEHLTERMFADVLRYPAIGKETVEKMLGHRHMTDDLWSVALFDNGWTKYVDHPKCPAHLRDLILAAK